MYTNHPSKQPKPYDASPTETRRPTLASERQLRLRGFELLAQPLRLSVRILQLRLRADGHRARRSARPCD
jgi:hypothetical protein